jgi:hypothetical protein
MSVCVNVFAVGVCMMCVRVCGVHSFVLCVVVWACRPSEGRRKSKMEKKKGAASLAMRIASTREGRSRFEQNEGGSAISVLREERREYDSISYWDCMFNYAISIAFTLSPQPAALPPHLPAHRFNRTHRRHLHGVAGTWLLDCTTRAASRD